MSSSRRAVGYWIAVWWPVAFMLAVIALESTSTFGADGAANLAGRTPVNSGPPN